MSLTFNEPKEGSKFATLKGDKATLIVEFSEGFIIEDEKKDIHLFCFAESLKGVEKFGDRNWKFEPQPLTIRFLANDFEWSMNGKTGTVKSTVADKIAIKYLSEWKDKDIQGSLDFSQSEKMLEMLLTGLDSKGNPVKPEMLSIIESETITLEEGELKLIARADGVVRSGKGGSSYKGQTELEKAKDRLTLVSTELGLEGEDKGLIGIATAIEAMPDKALKATYLALISAML